MIFYFLKQKSYEYKLHYHYHLIIFTIFRSLSENEITDLKQYGIEWISETFYLKEEFNKIIKPKIAGAEKHNLNLFDMCKFLEKRFPTSLVNFELNPGNYSSTDDA